MKDGMQEFDEQGIRKLKDTVEKELGNILDRLEALRVRDFRGINGNGFDGRGNFACGIKEQIIFPEIDFEKVDAVRGMDVCFVTTAKTDEEGKELLKALGAPFAENN